MAVDCKIIINFATQMKRKIVFVMNPISGTASKAGIPKLIDETIDKERFDYEIRMTEYAGHASEKYCARHHPLWFRQRAGTPLDASDEHEESHRNH